MKPQDRDHITYLEDMLLSMERIQEYISGLNFTTFKKDYKTVDAVIRNFEIIGEAAKNLPNDLKAKYPYIPWDEMYRLRNKASHEYFGVDYEIIWEISTHYLPDDQKNLEKIIEEEKSTGD